MISLAVISVLQALLGGKGKVPPRVANPYYMVTIMIIENTTTLRLDHVCGAGVDSRCLPIVILMNE